MAVQDDDEIADNIQGQRDELDMLEAMKKEEDEHKWQECKDGISGVLQVKVHTEGPVTVTLSAGRYRDRHKQADNSVTVTHLPPLYLHYQFSSSYPSHTSPTFTLSSSWLNFTQLSMLCRHLDDVWRANEGSVILYQWQHCLTFNTLTLLGIDNHLTVEYQPPRPPQVEWDPRGIQDMPHPLMILPSLVEYDRDVERNEFLASRYNCEICMSPVMGSECVRLNGCRHIHCTSCTKAHVVGKIEEGSVTNIGCPASKCAHLIPPGIVQQLVPPTLYARYDQLLLQRTLDGMSDIVYCPRPTCQCVTIKDKDSNMAVCPRCKFSFCILCKRTWHGISACKLLPNDIKELKDVYDNGDTDIKRSLEQQYGKDNLLKAFQEYDSHSWIKSNSKECPSCHANIEKSHGCNKMVCTHCTAHFCWLCSAILSRHNPYSHFQYGSSPCAGKLFDGVVMDDNILDN